VKEGASASFVLEAHDHCGEFVAVQVVALVLVSQHELLEEVAPVHHAVQVFVHESPRLSNVQLAVPVRVVPAPNVIHPLQHTSINFLFARLT